MAGPALAMLALGVLCTGVAYVWNYRMIAEIGPTAASTRDLSGAGVRGAGRGGVPARAADLEPAGRRVVLVRRAAAQGRLRCRSAQRVALHRGHVLHGKRCRPPSCGWVLANARTRPSGRPPAAGSWIEPAGADQLGQRVRIQQELDADALAELVGTRSYSIQLPADERAALLGRVRALARTHPQLVGRQHFYMPYVAAVQRYTLR